MKNSMQQSGSGNQEQMLVQQIAAALQNGAKPEMVVKALVSKGLDVEQAKGIVTTVMQQMGGGNSSPSIPSEAQMPAPQVAEDGISVDDPGDFWDELTKRARGAYNTGKEYFNKAVDRVTHADPYDLPLLNRIPANVKGMGRMALSNLGLVQGVPFLQKEDFTKAQLDAMRTAALSSAQRQAANPKGYRGMKYADYGGKDKTRRGKYTNIWSNNPIDMFTDPTRVTQTALGRFSPQISPDGSQIQVIDKYDFNNENNSNMLSRFLNWFDTTVPQDDPRRNVNFNIGKKYGGLYKAQEGVSIVDYLAGRGEKFSKAARKKLAEEKGIKDYDFSAKKNLELLALLRSQEKSPATPVRDTVPTGRTPVVMPASSQGRLGYIVPKQKSSEKEVSPTMTEGKRDAVATKAAEAKTPSWNKKEETPKTVPDKATAKKEAKAKSVPMSTYVDLKALYGLNPLSKVGIEKAREIVKQNPNARFVCTAAGCSQIASDAADAYGYDFNRGMAWDLGNRNSVIYQNPAYKGLVGEGILPNPTSFSAPRQMYSQPGTMIGLNRANNRVAGPKNDSYDYADQSVYPGSRGYEHVGFLLDKNTLLHGTGAGKGHPAFYTLDDVGNGIALPGYGGYQPVEAIEPGGIFGRLSGAASNLFKIGGSNPTSGTYSAGVWYKDGGKLPKYQQRPGTVLPTIGGLQMVDDTEEEMYKYRQPYRPIPYSPNPNEFVPSSTDPKYRERFYKVLNEGKDYRGNSINMMFGKPGVTPKFRYDKTSAPMPPVYEDMDVQMDIYRQKQKMNNRYMGGGNIPNYMQDPNPMYNFGGYFPQAPRFQVGKTVPETDVLGDDFSISNAARRIFVDPGSFDNWANQILRVNPITQTARAFSSGINSIAAGLGNKAAKREQARRDSIYNQQRDMLKRLVGFAEGGQTMDNTMMGMINVFEEGGIVEGQVMDVTPDMLQKLKAGGYSFEIIND